MKKTLYAEGGRPFYDDDIQTIQDEAEASVVAVVGSFGRDCILTGCQVSGAAGNYTVSPGVVFLGGQLLRFLGTSGIALPAVLGSGNVSVLDERTYQTGATKTCIQEQFAVVLAGTGTGLPLYPAGGFTLVHALRNQLHEPGEVKWGRPVLAHYDATGLGLPGTAAWGWALCNGANGTADLRGQFVVGQDPDRADYDTLGKTGGEETHMLSLAEIPTHGHGMGTAASDNTGSTGSGDTYAKSSGGNKGLDQNRRTTDSGGNQPHENRPPFYVLGVVQWVGY